MSTVPTLWAVTSTLDGKGLCPELSSLHTVGDREAFNDHALNWCPCVKLSAPRPALRIGEDEVTVADATGRTSIPLDTYQHAHYGSDEEHAVLAALRDLWDLYETFNGDADWCPWLREDGVTR